MPVNPNQPDEAADPMPKLPLVATTSNRGEEATVDARLVNGYVEKVDEGYAAIKRPGLFIQSSVPAGAGRGIFNWKGDIYVVVGASFYRNAVFVGAVAAGGGDYTFSSTLGGTPRLFFHNTTNAYRYDGGGGLVAVGGGYPADTVPGQAYLDGTTYVLRSNAEIRGSDINDLTTWNALNSIIAQMEPDGGVFMAKQLAYVIAIKEWTTEGFYDAGNPTGSPLKAAQGVLVSYGCRAAGSVQDFDNLLVWVGAAKNGSTFVVKMEGMRATIISTPAIERLLQQANFGTVYSWGLRISGHMFYGVTLPNSNLTLVCDLTTGGWFRWTDVNGNYMPYMGSTTTVDEQTLLLHVNTGQIFQASQTYYRDNLDKIVMDLYTPNWDGGTRKKKYLHRMAFMTDEKLAGQLMVRRSEDDYQHWGEPRYVNLNQAYPKLQGCGTFRKAAWHFRYEANTPFRMKAVELDVKGCSV
jgi:hypothetical protein